jgi:hypothetical protein
MHSTRGVVAVSATVAVLLGCGTPNGGLLAPDAGLADFSLVDVNPASPSSGQNVSPHDFDGRVSAWYFGHSS